MQKQQAGSALRGLVSIGTLYSFLFCTLASNVLLSMPILGGALYLTVRSALLFSQLRRPLQEGVLPRSLRRTGSILLAVVFLLLLALMTVYPIALESTDFWRLSGLVLCVALRPVLTRYSLEKSLIAHRKPLQKVLRAAGAQFCLLPPLLLMLLLSPLERDAVWSLAGGFVVCGLMDCLFSDRVRVRLQPFTPEDRAEMDALRGVHAYRMFQNVSLVIAAAVQATQVITFTYISVTAGALILCMALALLCTWAACLIADALLRRPLSRGCDPSFLMVVGLAVWLYGLILFIRCLDMPASVSAYVSLGLCTMGATVCVRTLSEMEADMRRVAAFGIGHVPSDTLDMIQRVRIDFASLLGQLVALLGLTLICVFTGTDFPGEWDALFRGFSPLLTLPALLLVSVALVFVLLFPMTKEHMEKPRRYMRLQKEGKENAALHDQLEAVVVRRSLKHYGIKLLLFVLRPLYYHKIKGKENIHLDEDIPCVFVCNHGEIYGPIVTNLYVPYSFRPWVTYEMMDRAVVADRVCNGTLKDFKWLPAWLCHLLVDRIAAPVLVWIMKSVDSIPVYHDNPRKLMQTFRETTAAMEAGDNILLFPENAATSETRRYLREGVSEFFTGFTMIGQLYYNKTGKCPLFVPLYANKRKRTITFGVPTRYNPDLPVNEEKERLCNYLRVEMLRVADIKEKTAE